MKKDWRRTSIEKRNTAKQNKSTEGKFARSRDWARSRPGGGGGPSLQAGYVAAPGEGRRAEREPALRNSSQRERHLLACRPATWLPAAPRPLPHRR